MTALGAAYEFGVLLILLAGLVLTAGDGGDATLEPLGWTAAVAVLWPLLALAWIAFAVASHIYDNRSLGGGR